MVNGHSLFSVELLLPRYFTKSGVLLANDPEKKIGLKDAKDDGSTDAG